MKACSDDRYLQSICAYRKPYFMIYIYPETKQRYIDFITESNDKCYSLYQRSVSDLYNSKRLSREQKEFLYWYELKLPVGMGDCSMNRICRYVESQLCGYKSQLHKKSNFDYTVLKRKHRCTDEHRKALWELEKYYRDCVAEYKCQKKSDKENALRQRDHLSTRIRNMAVDICPDDDERMNIILDMLYTQNANRQFCWDIIGELICKRLEEMNPVHTE